MRVDEIEERLRDVMEMIDLANAEPGVESHPFIELIGAELRELIADIERARICGAGAG